jgi:hypothetical protein
VIVICLLKVSVAILVLVVAVLLIAHRPFCVGMPCLVGVMTLMSPPVVVVVI